MWLTHRVEIVGFSGHEVLSRRELQDWKCYGWAAGSSSLLDDFVGGYIDAGLVQDQTANVRPAYDEDASVDKRLFQSAFVSYVLDSF